MAGPSYTPLPPVAPYNPPVGPNYEPSYSSVLGRQILDLTLPREFSKPLWYEQEPRIKLPSILGPSAADRARAFAYTIDQRGLGGPAPYESPGFPTRATLNMPWSASEQPNMVDQTMAGILGPGSALGSALGAVPGTGRGGTIPGTPIANTPVTLANFAAWGRERTIALLTWAASGGQGQYQQPAGAVFGEDAFDSEAPPGDPVGNLIWGIKQPFDLVNDVFEGVSHWWNKANAENRGLSVRSLAQKGTVTPFLVDWISSELTGGAAKFNMDSIMAVADQRGVDTLSMIAEYYDLDPQVVGAIFADPDMDDAALSLLVENQPLSRNPLVNLGLEFTKQMTLLVAPYAGVTRLAKGFTVASEAAGFSRGLALGERAYKGVEEATALQRAAQALGWGTRRALQVNSANTTIGWTIGGFEWGIKQLAVLGGNQAIVDAMDRAMWEMPLSMNPGINIVTAFSSHPLQALGLRTNRGVPAGRATGEGLLSGRVMIGTPGTLGDVGSINLRTGRYEGSIINMPGAKSTGTVVTVGDRLVRLDENGTQFVHQIETQGIDDFMPFFEKLGWERKWVDTAFGPGNIDELTINDLRDSLLFVSLSASRSQKGDLAALQGLDLPTSVERAQDFMMRNIGGAHRLFQAELSGSTDAISREIMGQFWRFADLNDTRQATIKARLASEWDPGLGIVDFLSWVKASKTTRGGYAAGLIAATATPVLRKSVNVEWLRQFREAIGRKYQTSEIVPLTEIDLMKRMGGGIESRGMGKRLIHNPKKDPQPVTRAELENIIDSILEDDARVREIDAAPPHEAKTEIRPDFEEAVPEISRALRISTRSLEAVRAAEAMTPEQLAGVAIPKDALKAAAAWAKTTPDALLADPKAAWAKVFEWMNAVTEEAHLTGRVRQSLSKFGALVKEKRALEPVLMDAAADAINFARDYLLNPIERQYLRSNHSLYRRLTEAMEALTDVQAQMDTLAESPLRSVNVEDFGQAGRFALPRDVPLPWVSELLRLIDNVGDTVAEGDLAVLQDPAVHPLLKLDILKRAELTDEQRAIVARFESEEMAGALERLVAAVMPKGEVDAPTLARIADQFDTYQAEVADAAANMTAIGTRFRIVEGRGHAPEVLDLYQRLDEFQTRASRPWRQEPVSTLEGPTVEQSVESANKIYERAKIHGIARKAEQELVAAQDEIALARQKNLEPVFDYTQPRVKVRKGGAKAAAAVAKEYNAATGLPTTWKAVKKPSGGLSHYEVYMGRLEPRAAEPEPVAIAEPVAEEAVVSAEQAVVSAEQAPIEAAPVEAIDDAVVATTIETIMGTESLLTYSRAIDDVQWDLFKGEDGSGIVRVLDPEAEGQAALQLKKYPDFESAKAAYDEGVALADQMSRPALEAEVPTPIFNAEREAALDAVVKSQRGPKWGDPRKRYAEAYRLAYEGKGPDPDRLDFKTADGEPLSVMAEQGIRLDIQAVWRDFEPEYAPAEAVVDEAVAPPGEMFTPEQQAGLDALEQRLAADPNVEVPGAVAAPPDALLVSGGSASGSNVPMARPDEPSFTIKATPKEPIRMVVDGVVKRVTGRALARLQGVPDSYPIPESEALAKTIIGNGVPPPLMKAVVDPLIPAMGKQPHGITMFSGGGLVEAGLKDQIKFTRAVEYDPKIAAHYVVAHGEHMTVGDVREVPLGFYQGAGYLHASPPCKNFSPAKAKALTQTEVARDLDLSLAQATADAIQSVDPRVVTIENVPKYIGTEALKIITDKLTERGYTWDVNVFDAADYGVPQHRNRMILRAVKGEKGAAGVLPPLPEKQPQMGWYDAIKDLELPDDPKGLAKWQIERLGKQGVTFGEEAPPPATYGAETAFPDARDVNAEDVPARWRLAELDELLTNADEGYDTTLQPRQRGRAGSQAQIANIEQRPKFELFLRRETGSEGAPVVDPRGMLVAGNGRVIGMRGWTPEFAERYRSLVRQRAAEFGLTESQVDSMRQPVLVREIGAEHATHEMAMALNAATGGMSLTETAFAIAHDLTPDDLAKLDLGETVSLSDALTAIKNTPFIQRVLSKLTDQEVRALSDAEGKLNADGLRVIESALLAKVIPDEGIVARFVESLDEGMGRLKSGIVESLGQLTEAQALIESGTRYPDVAIGGTLAEAINRLIGVKGRGLSLEDIRLELTGTVSMFDAAATQTSGELAWLLNGLTSANEVRDFLRAYASAVKSSADPQQVSMFDEGGARLSDMLNEAVREINGARREKNNAAALKRQQSGQEQAFGEDAYRTLPELPGFTDPDGTIPARFTNAVGQESFARDVPVVDSPEAAIDARLPSANRVLVYFDADNLDNPASLTQLAKGQQGITYVQSEIARVATQSLFDDPDMAVSVYRAIVQKAIAGGLRDGEPGRAMLLREFDAAARRINEGMGSGGDLLLVHRLSSHGWKVDVRGEFIGRPLLGKLKTLTTDSEFDALAEAWRGRAISVTTEFPHDLGNADAVILDTAVKDTGPFERGSGVVADLTPEKNAVGEAIESGAHTFVTRGGALDDAAREHTGASRANPPDSVLEINPPDQALLLRRAQERLTEAERKMAEAKTALDDLEPEAERPREEVPFPPEIYQLLLDYTNDPGTRQGKARDFFSEGPTSLGQVVDVIESIDAGIPPLGVAMESAEIQTLREGLVEWLQARLDVEPGGAPTRTQVKAAKAAERKRVASTLLESPEEWQDEMVKMWRALENIVKPTDDIVTGYEGTQYDLGHLPTLGKDGKPLSPRILATESLLKQLERVAPDMPNELAMGRKQDLPSRISTARFATFMRGFIPPETRRGRGLSWVAKQFAANPERDIRFSTVHRFLDELVGPEPTHLDPDSAEFLAYMKDRDHAAGILAGLHRFMAAPENMTAGRFRSFRKEYTLGADRFDRLARETIADKPSPDFADLPEWAQRFITASDSEHPFFDAWTKADNRIRSWFAEQPNGASRYVESLYAGERARRASRKQAGITQTYHVWRFLYDARWLALETIEAPTLTLFQEGPGALLDAVGIRFKGLKPERVKGAAKPLFVGLDDLSKMREDFAWWTAADQMGSGLRYRENYLLSLVKRRQLSDFPDILKSMAARDPELAATMKRMGHTPEQWVAALNDSWELYSAMSRKISPEEARAVYGPRLAKGIINQSEFDKLVAQAASGERHYIRIPALEAEIAASVGHPILEPVMERLRHLTEEAWQDAASLIYGQIDRSNVQRLLNHPLLWWPISYQIKATKWLAGLMFDRFLGVDSGSIGALTLDRIHQQHQEAMADPSYRKFFEDNRTLLFVASMFFPITPWDIGVSLSPFTRLAMGVAAGALGLPEDSPYRRNIFSFGPGYTYFNLVPRLGYELRKSPNAASQGAGALIGGPFPYSVPVGQSSSQQTQVSQETFGLDPLPLEKPFEPPATRFGP